MISSNTIVRDGMPFIGLVLRQVLPYVDKAIVTVSEKSNDGTRHELDRLLFEYPEKIILETENVNDRGDLTKVRNDQIRKTKSPWILTLDDDDYWCHDDLEKVLEIIKKEGDQYDGFSVSPYQMLDFKTYDSSWLHQKFFSKFLKNQPGLQYERAWPREIPYLNNRSLYWKENENMKCLPIHFYHLPMLKYNSFRPQAEYGGKFIYRIGHAKQFQP